VLFQPNFLPGLDSYAVLYIDKESLRIRRGFSFQALFLRALSLLLISEEEIGAEA